MSQNLRKVDHDNDQSLAQSLNLKTKYLSRLRDALAKHEDRLVYKLLDTTKYFHVIKQQRYANDYDYTDLIKDLRPELSHHLSRQLIKYLRKTYPFFYYHEDRLGHYQIYFGDWWGHKLFGDLDVINVKFNFDESEYNKLKRAFDDQHVDVKNMKAVQRQDRALTKLVKTQDHRTDRETELKADLKTNQAQARMPWNSARLNATRSKITDELKKLTRQDKQANDAKDRIEANQKKMLALSKESTVISYEKRCVKKYFGDLQQFKQNNKHLYYNYVSHLLAGGKD